VCTEVRSAKCGVRSAECVRIENSVIRDPVRNPQSSIRNPQFEAGSRIAPHRGQHGVEDLRIAPAGSERETELSAVSRFQNQNSPPDQ